MSVVVVFDGPVLERVKELLVRGGINPNDNFEDAIIVQDIKDRVEIVWGDPRTAAIQNEMKRRWPES